MKVAVKYVQARRSRLAQLLQQHRFLPLTDLCSKLGVSEATARRDLAALAKEHKITRTYGGAMSSFDQTFTSFRERQVRAPEAKRRIALTALHLIKPNSTCFLDVGTTLFALADALRQKPVKGLTLVTNSLPIAEMLGPVRGYAVHLLGGQLFYRQSLLLGGVALQTLKLWKFDCAFMGAEGMTTEGVWNSQPDIIDFQLAVFKRSRQSYVCLDAQKLDTQTDYLLVNWKANFRLITDATPALLEKRGIETSRDQLVLAN